MDEFIQLAIVVLQNKQCFIVCMYLKLLACFTIAISTVLRKKGNHCFKLELTPRLKYVRVKGLIVSECGITWSSDNSYCKNQAK